MANFKLKVKLGVFEYEAEGNEQSVCGQFEIFKMLYLTSPQNSVMSDFASPSIQKNSDPHPIPLPSATLPPPMPQNPSGTLQRLFLHDPLTSRVTCRILPSGPMKMADTILLLLLGHQELLGQPATSALALNQALAHSGGTVARLDRVLATYLKEQWILKTGKGKGGKYRLSKLGVEQAWEKAGHLVNLLPEEQHQ